VATQGSSSLSTPHHQLHLKEALLADTPPRNQWLQRPVSLRNFNPLNAVAFQDASLDDDVFEPLRKHSEDFGSVDASGRVRNCDCEPVKVGENS